MRTTKWILGTCLLCSAASGNGYLVVPNAQTSVAGVAGPGGLPIETNKEYRLQEILGSGQFKSGPITISRIAFRAAPGTGPVNATSPSLSLYLSTSPYYPNTSGSGPLITTTYANNTGPNNTLVYSGPVSLTSPGCAGPAPCSFDMVIVFNQPFLYDPGQGRLLLDFQYASFTGVSGVLDGVAFPFPPGGSVGQVSGGAKTGVGTFNPGGPIIQIGYTLASEPCDPNGSGTYPCPIGGSLELLTPPAGNVFDAFGTNSGDASVWFIEDPQNPGITLTATNPFQASGTAVPSLNEAFNFTTESGQPAITGLNAAITCGVTGAGSYSLTIPLPGQPIVLTCPSLSAPGATATVSAQVRLAALSALTTTLTFSGSSPTANDSVTVSGFVFQLQIPSAAPNCTYALDSGGSAFNSAGGGGSINVTADPGCDWWVFDAPSWVVVSNPIGSGNGTVKYQVLPNSGGDRSATLVIANLSFRIDQQPPSLPGLTFIGAMPHIAAEGEWRTEFVVVNKGTAAATARLTFFGDPGGLMDLPVTFPQQPPAAGPESAVSFDRLVAANASLIVDTAGPQTAPVKVGSANLTATSGQMDGFAIFHLIPGAQEAVVPVQTLNPPSFILAFDNTGGVVLGVAIKNVPAQAANIGIVIRDDTGAQLATDSIPMSAGGHMSFVLSQQYPVTANRRGTIEIDAPKGGLISVLGIRTTPLGSGFTLTTIPPLANVGGNGGSIAHIASGNGWQTTFVMVNIGTTAAQATLNFYSDVTGAPLLLPLSFPQTGSGTTTVASSVTQMLPAGATWLVQSDAPLSNPAPTTGSAQLKTNGIVRGFVIFRYNPNGQEAVVPLENRTAKGFVIAFDNTAGTATGIAINSVSSQAGNVPVIIRDDTGTQIGTDMLALAANGHISFTLDKYPATANIRGTIEFDQPPGAQIGVIGIRAPVTLTFTTLPPLAK